MLLIGLAILSTIGILAIAKATEIVQPIQVVPPRYPNIPRVEMAEGIGFDKTTNKTKQIVFIVMNYGNEKNIYLIVGGEVFRMSESGNISNPEVGTKIFFYKSEDGGILTVLVQEFGYGKIGIAGDFKSYLITFECPYNYKYYNYPRTQNPGLGKVQKEIRSEVRTETRPVKGSWKDIKIENIRLEEIAKSAIPINSWVS